MGYLLSWFSKCKSPLFSNSPAIVKSRNVIAIFFISHARALRVYLFGSVCARNVLMPPPGNRALWRLEEYETLFNNDRRLSLYPDSSSGDLTDQRSQRWYRLIHQSHGKCCARKPLKKRMGFSFRVLGLIKVQRKIDDHEEGSSSLHPAGKSNTRVQHFNQAAFTAVCPCLERLLIYMFLVRLAPLQMLSAVPWRKGGENLLLCSNPCLNLQLCPASNTLPGRPCVWRRAVVHLKSVSVSWRGVGGESSCKASPSRTH